MCMGNRAATDQERTATLDLVLEVAVLLGEDMHEGLAEDDLTPARARVVWELAHRGPCTQRDLAAVLGVTPRNVTGLIDALAESGYVTREPHPGDRRATLVTFTERGERVATKLREGHVQLAELLFAGMPPTTYRGLHRGLESLLVTLRELAAGAAAERARRSS